MIDDKMRADFDQGIAAMMELWPPMWRQLFDRLKEEGFTEQQAMDLLKTYILSQGVNGVKP